MTNINHRRTNRPEPALRYDPCEYHNGYTPRGDDPRRTQRTGLTGFLDKSLHGWGAFGPISNVSIGAGIGNDFANGHRGMAKAVRGAKKFVRSRIRFHENAATRKLAQEDDED
jgi:hypothetical protein